VLQDPCRPRRSQAHVKWRPRGRALWPKHSCKIQPQPCRAHSPDTAHIVPASRRHRKRTLEVNALDVHQWQAPTTMTSVSICTVPCQIARRSHNLQIRHSRPMSAGYAVGAVGRLHLALCGRASRDARDLKPIEPTIQASSSLHGQHTHVHPAYSPSPEEYQSCASRLTEHLVHRAHARCHRRLPLYAERG
jgi:hypothetical protein